MHSLYPKLIYSPSGVYIKKSSFPKETPLLKNHTPGDTGFFFQVYYINNLNVTIFGLVHADVMYESKA